MTFFKYYDSNKYEQKLLNSETNIIYLVLFEYFL